MNDFLPQDYEIPKTSAKYFKPQSGDNRIRVLGSAIVGNEGWKETTLEDGTSKRSPVRKPMGVAFVVTEIDDPSEIKHFWAFPVFDYADAKVKVYELTQKTIMEFIKTYTSDEDYGSPTGYDLVITKKGEKMETKYSVIAKPPKPIDLDVAAKWDEAQKAGFDLNRLFLNGDPFTPAEQPEPVSDESPAAQAMRKGGAPV